MDTLLIAIAVLGRFLLIWRRKSLGGYFGSRGSEPAIFTYALGNLLVGGLGFVAQWGSIALLVGFGDFYAVIIALLLAFVSAPLLFRLLYGPPRNRATSALEREAPVAAAQPARRSGEPERGPKHGLSALRSGVSPETAIEIMLSACNRPDTMFITEAWINPRLALLRSRLSNPITGDQAEALRDAILQRCPFKDVLNWLDGEPLAWKEYQIRKQASEAEAKRARAEKIRKNWDWEKVKRLRQAGFHVNIPSEVLFTGKKPDNSSDPKM